MKRIGVIGLAITAALLALAGPVLAKGEGTMTDGKAFIFGPGLSKPIELGGTLSVFPGADQAAPADTGSKEFTAFVVGSGLVPTETGYFGEKPQGNLGPAYLVTVLINEGYPPNTTSLQLYPYAAGGPVFLEPLHQQAVFGTSTALGWWHAPSLIVGILESHGLPLTAPPAAPAPVANPAPQPVLSSGLSRVWIAVAVIAALTLLLIGAALVGRPRTIRTPV